VIQSDARNADALTIRGDCHFALGDAEAAAKDYESAMLITGPTVTLLTKLAQVRPIGLPPNPQPTGAVDGPKVLAPQEGTVPQSQAQPDAALDSLSGKLHLEAPNAAGHMTTWRPVRFRIP
jgi:hypothetical protein